MSDAGGIKTNWLGEELRRRALYAQTWGIDKVMSDCVIYSKDNHPGWVNRTGTAEGSIRTVEEAHQDERGVVGIWGSPDVDYMIWLELKHGSCLRNSADVNYRTLAARVAEAWKAVTH
jgi:hypothetical protein